MRNLTALRSPNFFSDADADTQWYLEVQPRGQDDDDAAARDHLSVHLTLDCSPQSQVRPWLGALVLVGSNLRQKGLPSWLEHPVVFAWPGNGFAGHGLAAATVHGQGVVEQEVVFLRTQVVATYEFSLVTSAGDTQHTFREESARFVEGQRRGKSTVKTRSEPDQNPREVRRSVESGAAHIRPWPDNGSCFFFCFFFHGKSKRFDENEMRQRRGGRTEDDAEDKHRRRLPCHVLRSEVFIGPEIDSTPEMVVEIFKDTALNYRFDLVVFLIEIELFFRLSESIPSVNRKRPHRRL